MGCGLGLVARLAAARGYQATGLDSDPLMIKAARCLARYDGSAAHFIIGDVTALPPESTDVVSAASLLAVLDDKVTALNSLWGSVRPGGYLLIIEPTKRMNTENARKTIQSGLPPKRIHGLRLWAAARQNKTIDPKIYDVLHEEDRWYQDLLDGLVGVWIFRKGEQR